MISEALNVTGTTMQKPPTKSEQIDVSRRKITEQPDDSQKNTKVSTLQPEEVLTKIKALTENGIYSVRFESDAKTHQLVVKVVDSETQEVIRQIPAEAMLGLKEALSDFQGNLVDTTS
jgi:flagellar protein FlaG